MSSNKKDLLNLIDIIKSGISRHDVSDCYSGIKDEITEMVSSGI